MSWISRWEARDPTEAGPGALPVLRRYRIQQLTTKPLDASRNDDNCVADVEIADLAALGEFTILPQIVGPAAGLPTVALAAGITFCLSFALTPLAIAALARRGVFDHPNLRSSHLHQTVRGGGIAPALAALAAGAAMLSLDQTTSIALLAGAAAFGAIGAYDDIRSGVSPMVRLTLQAVTALGVSTTTFLAASTTHTTTGLTLLALVATVWIVGYVNAFNFMDGINGISATQTVFAGIALAISGHHHDLPALSLGGVLVTGAALGFAPFNFPRARVFLGDVGSYFLGGWLAVLAVVGYAGGITPEALLAPFTLYVADTSTTVIRRIRRGDRWHEAHREHAYQRLVQEGWSHTRTTLTVGGLVAACSGLGLMTLNAFAPGRIAAATGIATLTVGYLALPLLVTRRRSPAPWPAVDPHRTPSSGGPTS
ncbi:MAG: glycosyltransferase family 4 protein [Actinobacteria bacterium]|nr:glycosyltransferase family 4 protein [Actinomycetota bacterium]